ncbi:YHS domain-containing (seleno)protein [Coraliomargarita sp. SDUM461003]|uniref:YHS domain-containing (Seleno)protein n=1 Tax=Thalassobacterium maritimum TaxID=3041265 RepID=A0ABU1AX32_9BACT|nr:YHS domain-containing (seleno)protein [Coraliomargarita sp. SDUM461003]MDQ8208723.1 YHS domain-containing (seleno)protein [Coraliomargarita sp. SDUM461003]
MKSFKNLLQLAVLLIATATVSFAAKSPSQHAPAVGGYDLVSYQQMSGPVHGSKSLMSKYHGSVYIFANEANLAMFEANPEKYLPAYDGYCAYGVAIGKKLETDPTVYDVVDGQLYLNYNSEVKVKWAADKQANIEKADANWSKLM